MLSADFNRDGAPDLFLFAGASIVFNDGHGGFSGPNPIPTSDSITAAVVGDFNHDGAPDIAACLFNPSAETQSLAIFLNDGAGGFTISESLPISSCNAIAAGDTNKDGKQDVVVATNTYNGSRYVNVITTYFGDGTGKLSGSVVQQGFSLNAVNMKSLNNCYLGGAVGGDLNNDGVLDLVLLGNCSGVPSGSTLYLAQGNGTGKFVLSEITESNITYAVPTLTDVNHDGKLDLVLTGYDVLVNSQSIWYQQDQYALFAYNNGGGKFTFKTLLTETFTPSSNGSDLVNAVAAADLNRDGYADAIVGITLNSTSSNPGGKPEIVILNGDSNGGFTQSQSWNVDGFPTSIIAEDLNKDNRADIAAIEAPYGGQAALWVYLNQMTSSSCSAPTSPGVHVCSPVAGHRYTSPVHFSAAGTGTNPPVNHLELWIDGGKIGNYAGNKLNTSVALTSGSHAATVVEVDSKGAYLKSAPVNFTVQ